MRRETTAQRSERDRAYHAAKRSEGPISADELRRLLTYDAVSGEFRYKISRGGFHPGDVAGTTKPDGRVHINLKGRVYRAHRLAWLYVTGEWPSREIDHRDGNPSNNSWQNLRDVSPTVNKQNVRRALASNRYSGLLGAHWCKQGEHWKSSIKVNGKPIFLGVFPTAEDAHQAYLDAKRKLHEGCTI